MMSIRLCHPALLRNYFFRLKSPVSIQPEINQPVLPCLPLQPSPCVPTLRLNLRLSVKNTSLPPSAAEANRESEKARRETEALLSPPKAKRYSRGEFVAWIDEA